MNPESLPTPEQQPDLPAAAPPRKVGPGHPPHPPFSSTHQPPAENKVEGRQRQLRGKMLVQAILGLKVRGKDAKAVIAEASKFFNIDKDELTAEALLLYQQAKKGILNGDGEATRLLLERAWGKPPMQVHLDRPPDAEPTEIILPGGRKIAI